jgi:glutamate synthase domain-containing protein 1
MFINQSFVAIAFKLINFFVLIGIGYYAFRKFIKGDILFSIAQKEADHDFLVDQQAAFEHKQKELDLRIKREILQCHNFKSKIDMWRKVILHEEDKQEQKFNELIVALKKRNAEIALKKENQRIQNDVLNTVIADLEKSLSHDFKDPKKNADYLNSIVHFMNERVS